MKQDGMAAIITHCTCGRVMNLSEGFDHQFKVDFFRFCEYCGKNEYDIFFELYSGRIINKVPPVEMT